MAFETGGPTFSRTVIALFLIVQIVAIKLLVQKFQDTGLISLPSWVPFIDKANCGHLREYEYVLVGRKVVTPDGVVPAAGVGGRSARSLSGTGASTLTRCGRLQCV